VISIVPRVWRLVIRQASFIRRQAFCPAALRLISGVGEARTFLVRVDWRKT
jgi:hypothetical protein